MRPAPTSRNQAWALLATGLGLLPLPALAIDLPALLVDKSQVSVGQLGRRGWHRQSEQQQGLSFYWRAHRQRHPRHGGELARHGRAADLLQPLHPQRKYLLQISITKATSPASM